MNNFKRLIIILIRLQALAIMLVALIHWAVAAAVVIITLVKLKQIGNYEIYIVIGALYFVVGLIMYLASQPLANYFIATLPDDEPPSPDEYLFDKNVSVEK